MQLLISIITMKPSLLILDLDETLILANPTTLGAENIAAVIDKTKAQLFSADGMNFLVLNPELIQQIIMKSKALNIPVVILTHATYSTEVLDNIMALAGFKSNPNKNSIWRIVEDDSVIGNSCVYSKNDVTYTLHYFNRTGINHEVYKDIQENLEAMRSSGDLKGLSQHSPLTYTTIINEENYGERRKAVTTLAIIDIFKELIPELNIPIKTPIDRSRIVIIDDNQSIIDSSKSMHFSTIQASIFEKNDSSISIARQPDNHLHIATTTASDQGLAEEKSSQHVSTNGRFTITMYEKHSVVGEHSRMFKPQKQPLKSSNENGKLQSSPSQPLILL
jgi:hypothetical protein